MKCGSDDKSKWKFKLISKVKTRVKRGLCSRRNE